MSCEKIANSSFQPQFILIGIIGFLNISLAGETAPPVESIPPEVPQQEMPASLNKPAEPMPPAVPGSEQSSPGQEHVQVPDQGHVSSPDMDLEKLGEGDGPRIQAELLKMRDPFKRPDIAPAAIKVRTELERYSVESYKLVAVTTGPKKIKALVLSPDGKTYFLNEKSKIGLRGGEVVKITPEAVYVREKIVNVVGQHEILNSVIKLPEPGQSSKAGNGGSSASP